MRLSTAHWFVLRELVKRDLRSRYAGSVLGFLWSFLQPLWQLVLFSFVFAGVLKVTPVGEHTSSFALFLFCGLLPWLALQEGVVRSITAITDNAVLVKKLSFPSEILVLAVVLAALVHEAIATLVFVGVLAVSGELAWRGLPWLLVALPLQVALTLGLGLLFASLQVFMRDTSQLLSLAFGGWFYLTPIVYPLAYVPERFRSWIEWNPLTALVGLYRYALLGGERSEITGLASLGLCSVVVLSLGAWVFARLKPAFVDEI